MNSFNCHCLAGYAGHSCSVNIDECKSFPCFNGGRITLSLSYLSYPFTWSLSMNFRKENPNKWNIAMCQTCVINMVTLMAHNLARHRNASCKKQFWFWLTCHLTSPSKMCPGFSPFRHYFWRELKTTKVFSVFQRTKRTKTVSLNLALSWVKFVHPTNGIIILHLRLMHR